VYRLRPAAVGVTAFELRRDFGDDEVLLLLETGSYRLPREELTEWLRRVRCEQVDRVVDLAWSFPCVRYDLVRQEVSTPSRPPDSSTSSVGDLLHAMVGRRVPFVVQDYQGAFDDPLTGFGGFRHGQ
jgi:hypothetical protein